MLLSSLVVVSPHVAAIEPPVTGNLVVANGTVSPASLSAQIINGTVAHIKVTVPDNQQYSLKNPLDVQVALATAASNVVLFRDIDISGDGTWKVARGSTTQTTFRVLDFNGTLVGLQSDQVVTMRPSEYEVDIVGPTNHKLQSRHYSDITHECTVSGSNDPNTSVTVQRLLLRRIGFVSEYTVQTDPINYPVVGLYMEMGGGPPSLGANIVALSHSLDIAPPGSVGIYRQRVFAFVYLTESDFSHTVTVQGSVKFDDPVPPNQYSCGPVYTDDFSLAIYAGT